MEKTAFFVNNGKFEFTRLPSIFQRTLDDILRDHIANSCYVYIDDIIIFSKEEQTHISKLDEIFRTLNSANIKVQLDNCVFFKKEVEFLGFIVTNDGVKANPTKVEAIVNYPTPSTVRELRSVLGVCSYYRRFIKDFSHIAKLLTNLLRGNDGMVSKSESMKKPLQLNDNAKEAFE